MTGDKWADLDSLLEIWENATGPENRLLRHQAKIPVIRQGKIIGYVSEKMSDMRSESHHFFVELVRALRAARKRGADANLVWLALEVGAGSVGISHRESKFQSRSNAGKSRRGHKADRPWEPQEEDKPFLRELTKLEKKMSYNSRVIHAARSSGNQKPLSTLRRYGEKAGLR